MNPIVTKNQNSDNTNYIQITNNGWYFARAVINYVVHGLPIKKYTDIFLIGQTRKLYINKQVPGFNLLVNAIVGFDQAVTIINGYMYNVGSRCYNLTGTLFNAGMQQVKCSGVETIAPNNGCCCNWCNGCRDSDLDYSLY